MIFKLTLNYNKSKNEYLRLSFFQQQRHIHFLSRIPVTRCVLCSRFGQKLINMDTFYHVAALYLVRTRVNLIQFS